MRNIQLAALLGLAIPLLAQDKKQVEYGRYLVEEVSKCQECHTSKLENGEIDNSKALEGATLNFGPLKPADKAMEKWHKNAPGLTPDGKLWDKWKEEGIRNFLITSLNPKGGKADIPMPSYKFKPADAEAIVAYLKSLKK